MDTVKKKLQWVTGISSYRPKEAYTNQQASLLSNYVQQQGDKCGGLLWPDAYTKVAYSLHLFESTRGLMATDHVILNHGQVMWTTPEQPHLLTTTPLQGLDISALDRFNVHRCPTRLHPLGTPNN
ncbi:uncharacterized protein TNCV_4176411 [Trichonephila clavipes]|nr:uncharacterized protein TNCV_4176411 [Trichonephila clavipes]